MIKIKALSVNKAWQGRRFKTPDYKTYEQELLYLLPKRKVGRGELELYITFGVSNRASDIDNLLKPFLDCLQKKYSFNDNRIYFLEVRKEIVKKGDDFIDFDIYELST